MRSFKMKDLMIRIQPEALDFKNNLPAEHHFGTCTSPSNCGTPSTCSNAQSCNPSRCQDKPKPRPKHHDEFSGAVIELADLKHVLASMKIKMSDLTDVAEAL